MKRKFLTLIFCLLFVAMPISACSKYNSFYADSEAAIEAYKDAIKLLDYCIDGEITEEECVDQMKIVAGRLENSEDLAEKNTALNINMQAYCIEVLIELMPIGTVTIVDLKDAVQDARDSLYDELYR